MSTFKIDFGAGFDVTESPADEFNIALDLTEVGTILSGLDAAKPAAAVANRLYFATDTGILYRDTGAQHAHAAVQRVVKRVAYHRAPYPPGGPSRMRRSVPSARCWSERTALDRRRMRAAVSSLE